MDGVGDSDHHKQEHPALHPQGDQISETHEPVKINTLNTPRGGEFRVVLEDGTEVWLNSESQLIYPETFDGPERRVKVEGEAYFKVAKNEKQPFYVETAGQEVRVFGTEFNVHNYPEDEYVSTVLIEGSISLSRRSNPQNCLLLTPGHQVQFDKNTEEARISAASVEVMTSWRTGQFVFENQTLEHIMQDLARWYNFDFTFEDEQLREMLFMGSVPRYAHFSQVLLILEKSGGLSFTLSDDVVVVAMTHNK